VFWKKRQVEPSLIGKWMLVNGEPVAMEFRGDGKLAYVVVTAEGKTQTMRLIYRVEGDTLVTDQPSSPR